MTRGRPRIHADDAERQAAYRERQALAHTKGEMALVIIERPTLALIRYAARKLAERAEDKAHMGAEVARAMLQGLQAGAGGNCADAARNFVRHEKMGARK